MIWCDLSNSGLVMLWSWLFQCCIWVISQTVYCIFFLFKKQCHFKFYTHLTTNMNYYNKSFSFKNSVSNKTHCDHITKLYRLFRLSLNKRKRWLASLLLQLKKTIYSSTHVMGRVNDWDTCQYAPLGATRRHSL